jgi:hypothetical protein
VNKGIEEVVVWGRKERAAFSFMYLVASWGEMWNNATGNTRASFDENFHTGVDLWKSIAMGHVIAKTSGMLRGFRLFKGLRSGRQIKSVDDYIASVGKLQRIGNGVRQATIKGGNIEKTFSSLTEGSVWVRGNTYRLTDGTFVTKYNSSTNGLGTIWIDRPNGMKYKIRFE